MNYCNRAFFKLSKALQIANFSNIRYASPIKHFGENFKLPTKSLAELAEHDSLSKRFPHPADSKITFDPNLHSCKLIIFLCII